MSPLIRSKRVFASRLNRNPWIRKHYQLFLPWFPRHIEAFDLNDYSLVISSSHCVAKGVIPAPDARHVSYIHSPMRYAWDQYYSYFAGAGFWRGKIIQREISRLRVWDVSSAARVDRFHRQFQVCPPAHRKVLPAPGDGHPPAGGYRFFSAGRQTQPRLFPAGFGPGALQKHRPGHGSLPAAG